MNDIAILNEQEVLGKQFKVYGTAENPLILAKDVAEWIDYAKTGQGYYDVSNMLSTVDDDEKALRKIFVDGKSKEYWFLTEDGLYEVLMQSKKPIAKQFKKEVKKILKSIRMTGGYIAGQDDLSDDELLEKAVLVAQKKIAERDRIIEQQKQKIEQDKPKTIFADAVTASKTSILVGELAKILRQNGYETGEKRLFAQLRNEGYLICRKGTDYNMPTQRAMELGLFEIKETVVAHSDGHTTVNKTPKVTGRGQQYFINKYLDKTA